MKTPIKITINENQYWFLKDGVGEGPIAYLDHCDENGEFRTECAFETSFAFVFLIDGEQVVKRYNDTLGKLEDFIPTV